MLVARGKYLRKTDSGRRLEGCTGTWNVLSRGRLREETEISG